MSNASPQHVLLQPVQGHTLIPWYESADNARQVLDQFSDFTFSHIEWQAYAWPGGYEIHYYAKDGGVLCHQCANKELYRTIDPEDAQFYIIDSDVNYEDTLYCDHCNQQIEAAYGEVEE